MLNIPDQENCADGTETCDANAVCSPVPSEVCVAERPINYKCVCNQGYTGDGLDCQGKLTAEARQVTRSLLSYPSFG